ncbi:hypothetical protein ACFXG4_51180 [Nocardia sp. NPDC059246]|uniref:hypothetical protein n=1 Tax=unclassified Nocardia TaxID=2637762 RepID=UPI00369052FC
MIHDFAFGLAFENADGLLGAGGCCFGRMLPLPFAGGMGGMGGVVSRPSRNAMTSMPRGSPTLERLVARAVKPLIGGCGRSLPDR